jgi:hypothetical protein
MHVHRLISPLLLSLVLGGQVVLVPSQVPAQDCPNGMSSTPGVCCCGCGNCWMRTVYGWNCVCNESGTDPNCGYCVDDSAVSQSNASTEEDRLGQSSVPGPLVSTVANSNVTERVMELMRGGKCFRNKVALSLLGNTRDGLKLKPVRFDRSNAQDQTLAF